jgi:microcystin-dependent protein
MKTKYIYMTIFIILLFGVYHIFTKKDNSMPTQMNAQQSTSSAQAITAIDSSGNLSALSFPSGFILIWYPPDNKLTTLALIQKIIPSGWAICDGTNGTPDLRGRFVLMAQDTIPTINVPTGSSVHAIGQIGGEEKHVLTEAEMPSHNHNANTGGGNQWNDGNGQWGVRGQSAGTTSTGGNQPHNIMPPYYTLVYVMKL